jgi:hypothetical protein
MIGWNGLNASRPDGMLQKKKMMLTSKTCLIGSKWR